MPRRDRLAEIRKRVEEALALDARVTRGPYRIVREDETAGDITFGIVPTHNEGATLAWVPEDCNDNARNDADGFCAFRTLAPALAKDVAILLAAVDVLRDVRPYVLMCKSVTSGRDFQENANRHLRRIDIALQAIDDSKRHDRCRICGRSEFVVAVDNSGAPYMGCKHCVVMPLPPEGEG